jgi:alkylated DNA repair dioxygenase AlkB
VHGRYIATCRTPEVERLERDRNRIGQLSFFEPPRGVLIDDERGRVTYEPDFVDAARAAVWFDELRTAANWRTHRRRMYERDVDVPRLIGHYWLDDPSDTVPTAILEAAAMLTAHLNVPFNAVGLNLYRDERDSVAPHNDHLSELREGFPIALLSLGATRRMTIRAKTTPRLVLHVDLLAGSLLVMDYASQLHYTHGVPKAATPVGVRISLAFRVKPPRAGVQAGGVRPTSGIYDE